jgi:hypothetical protein
VSAPVRPPTRSWRELAARGAVIAFEPGPVVRVTAPTDVATDLRAALAWRVEAMRADLHTRELRGEIRVTPRARPDLVLPLAPRLTWRGPQEQRNGGIRWVTLSAQRPVAGLCGSCGEDCGETGDCPLCNAARIGALRTEGRLPPPTVYVPPERPSPEAWRAQLYREIARPDTSPAPSPCTEWTCDVCGHRWWSFAAPEGGPRDACGRCELKAADTLSLVNLGGPGR